MRKQIEKQIEKQIHDNVQSYLDEFDIDGLIKRVTSKKSIDQLIKTKIKEEVDFAITNAFLTAFKKHQRIIDAFAENKLRSLLIELGVN